MSSEFEILAWYGLLIVVTVFAQVLLALPQVGLVYLSSPRDEQRRLTGVAGRLERAVVNMTIGFALLAGAVLALSVQQRLGPTTLKLAQTVLLMRLLYAIIYGAGVPWLRTASWLVVTLATTWMLVLAI